VAPTLVCDVCDLCCPPWAELVPPAGFASQGFAQQKLDSGLVSDAFFCGQRVREMYAAPNGLPIPHPTLFPMEMKV
jgi:hypothetical protein